MLREQRSATASVADKPATSMVAGATLELELDVCSRDLGWRETPVARGRSATQEPVAAEMCQQTQLGIAQMQLVAR